MADEYQPGLGLSNLRVAFQNYIAQENKRKEEEAKNRDLMVSGAKVGKSAYDYWAMDQMGKYKDLLSEKIVGADGELRNVYETSDIYRDKSTFGKLGWDKWHPTFEKGRMFTPASERVQLTDTFQAIEDNPPVRPEIPVDTGMDPGQFDSPPISIGGPGGEPGFDSFEEWDTLYEEIDYFPRGEGIDDIPIDTDIGALGIDSQDIPDLYEMYMDDTITASASSAPGPMTASGGMSDYYGSGGEVLGSTDEALSATGEASKYSKLVGGLGKGLGALGTAYGAYNLATNWDDMSDAERAQGALQTIGGTMALTGIGAPIGLGLSAIGTIWDLLD